eukprot:170730-Chlamydomonas_euryale.AAC.4
MVGSTVAAHGARSQTHTVAVAAVNATRTVITAGTATMMATVIRTATQCMPAIRTESVIRAVGILGLCAAAVAAAVAA